MLAQAGAPWELNGKSDSELLIDQEKNLYCQEEAYPR